MKKITNDNLLTFIHDYFSSIGLKREAKSFFTDDKFDNGIILCLPDVCLLPKNKSKTSKSKQTHIHVTGSGRYFFYPEDLIDNSSASSNDKKQLVVVSRSNIAHLKKREYDSFDTIDNIDTFTFTKISYRESQEPQVQVSKIRLDGEYFISLREGLFIQDLLVFLKYKNEDKFFAIGIPIDFYKDKYELPTNPHVKKIKGASKINVKTALKEVQELTDLNATIKSSDEIADSVYQQLVDESDADDTQITYTSQKYIPSTNKSTSTNRPNTNPRLGKTAIKQNNFQCIFSTDDCKHETFIKPNGTPYMEVHHIVPLEQQSKFENKLDTIANLAPVCPLCHRKLHYGRTADVLKMLEFLYIERQELLQLSGIDISEEDLKSYY